MFQVGDKVKLLKGFPINGTRSNADGLIIGNEYTIGRIEWTDIVRYDLPRTNYYRLAENTQFEYDEECFGICSSIEDVSYLVNVRVS